MFKSTDCIIESIPSSTELQVIPESVNKEPIKESVIQLENIQLHGPSEPGNKPINEDEETKSERLRRYVEVWVAECIGTAILLLMGCMGVLNFSETPLPYQGAISFGFIVATIIQIFGHISAAHLNPCVTICFYILGDISLPMVLHYFLAELLGATIGFGILKALTPSVMLESQPSLCCTLVDERLSLFQAFGIEFIATGILVLLVCACTDPANSSKQDSVPIKFGVYIFVISIIGGPLTGASMNPARSLAPALWNGVLQDQWMYWVSPILASVVFPLMYQAVFTRGGESRIKRKISKKLVITKAK